ncbi:CwfJ C-terminus 1-domain-containing protein-like protein [Protomyces lactucae-debilis]|uniref:CwfJ C-terminus 1-domain-containing protein-like protein n=1 Tax=Protomyces lactucae-debilis TaxID=2754530 RepID=A0A1Y2F816_PROLT|nr:CwfJ C-terminus 1-domain-containing protein-like protein [Protomyces lactucae-debilis]ORY80048.1 CwfJ C-terminus 1-domain-containing protein-like protein [Protomyces lactucae-debilis]
MKVLVLGDSRGDYERTFKKAASLLSKQSFDCIICLGDLLPPTCSTECLQELFKSRPVEAPCYFMQGPAGVAAEVLAKAEAEHGQVAANLFYLGESGLLTLTEGLGIGFHSESVPSAVPSLLGAKDLDMLLLDELPPLNSELKSPYHDTCIQLLEGVLPKYVFACDKQYAERRPFKQMGRVVREIALASVANAEKSKWFYAFNWQSQSPAPEVLAAAVSNPYRQSKPGPEPDQEVVTANTADYPAAPGKRKSPPEGYCCKLCSQVDDHYYKDCPNRQQRKRQKTIRQVAAVRPDTCFFCLSNPTLARHLLVSIGDHGSYMALPKGAMTPNHVLVVPVSHVPTIKSLDEAREEVEGEMLRYTEALDKFYATIGSIAVVFELARSTGVHIHWQVIPIDPLKCDEIMAAFRVQGEANSTPLREESSGSEADDFFRVTVPSRNITLTAPLQASARFDLQFGRRVIANVMGVPKRAHWKDCIRTDAQEASDADAFKRAFKEFDPSL